MTLTCKLGRPHVFDLKGQRKKVKAVRLNHCQLGYRLYQTSFQFPRTALRAWCHHQHVLLANDINKNIRVIRGRQVSGGSFKWFKKKKKTRKEARLYQNVSTEGETRDEFHFSISKTDKSKAYTQIIKGHKTVLLVLQGTGSCRSQMCVHLLPHLAAQ